MVFVIQVQIIVVIAVDVCKCRNPLPEKFEFEIVSTDPIISNVFPEDNNSYFNLDELKEKTICNYLHILDQLECGIQPDLEMLLEEISLINIYGERFRILP